MLRISIKSMVSSVSIYARHLNTSLVIRLFRYFVIMVCSFLIVFLWPVSYFIRYLAPLSISIVLTDNQILNYFLFYFVNVWVVAGNCCTRIRCTTVYTFYWYHISSITQKRSDLKANTIMHAN